MLISDLLYARSSTRIQPKQHNMPYGMTADFPCKSAQKRVIRDKRGVFSEQKQLHLDNPVNEPHKPLGYNYPGGYGKYRRGYYRGNAKPEYICDTIYTSFSVEQTKGELLYYFGKWCIVGSCTRMRFRKYSVTLRIIGEPEEYFAAMNKLKSAINRILK